MPELSGAHSRAQMALEPALSRGQTPATRRSACLPSPNRGDCEVPSEAKVGLLFIVFLLLGVGTLIYLTGELAWFRSDHVIVHFPDVEGLTNGSSVLLAGKEIGRVARMELATPEDLSSLPDLPVVVYVTIPKDTELLSTDEFVITQAGMLGNRQISVRRRTQEELAAEAAARGEPAPTSTPLSSGDHVAGTRLVGLTELAEDGRAVMSRVQEAIADFQDLYAGPQMSDQLPRILTNVEQATAGAVEFSQVLARLSVQNEAYVGRIAREVAQAAGELNVSARRIRAMVQSSAPDIESSTAIAKATLEQTSGNLRRAAERIELMATKSAQDVEATTGIVARTAEMAGTDLAAISAEARALVQSSSGNIQRAAEQVEQATATMAALMDTTGRDIGQATGRVNELVQKAATDLEVASGNLAKMSETLHGDITTMSGTAREAMEASAGDIRQTTASLAKLAEGSSDDIRRTTRRIHDLVAMSPLPTDLTAAGQSIRKSAENVEGLTRTMRDTLGESGVSDQIKASLANIERASEHLVSLTEQGTLLARDSRDVLAKTSANLNNQEMWADLQATTDKLHQAMDDLAAITGHTKEFITDPKVTEDLTQSVANVRELTHSGVEVAKKADEALTRVNRTMDGVQSVTRNLSPSFTRAYANLEWGDKPGLRADVVADLYFGSENREYWRVGARNVGDSESLILQRALLLSDRNMLRLGLLGNELAAGLDHSVGSHLKFELDLWDPSDLRLDGRGILSFGRDWDLVFGANRLFDHEEPFLGIRRHFVFGSAPAEGP